MLAHDPGHRMRHSIDSVVMAALPIFAGAAIAGPREDGDAARNNKDYPTAIRLWNVAADQGNAVAQFRLCKSYFLGDYAAKNIVVAYKWCILGAAKGNDQADTMRVIMGAKTTPAQIAEGPRLADEWKAK